MTKKRYKPAARRMESYIGFNVTREQNGKILEAARSSGLGRAEWLRLCIEKELANASN